MIKPVTQDMAKQRRGRVGRVAPGHWYPVYTQATFEAMQPAQFPEFITDDATAPLLSIIAKDGSLDLKSLDLMDMPAQEMLWYALEKLFVLGAINTKLEITETGTAMNLFRKMRPENAKMILVGYHYKADILDLITIAALLDTQQIFSMNYVERKVFDKPQRQKYLLSDRFIDLIILFEEFRDACAKYKMSEIQKWCADAGISYSEMIRAIEFRDSIIEDMVGVIGFEPLANHIAGSLKDRLQKAPDIAIDEIVLLKKCIYEGYACNVAKYDGENYISVLGDFKLATPAGLSEPYPRYIVYAGVTFMNGMYNVTNNLYSTMDGFVEIDPTLI